MKKKSPLLHYDWWPSPMMPLMFRVRSWFVCIKSRRYACTYEGEKKRNIIYLLKLPWKALHGCNCPWCGVACVCVFFLSNRNFVPVTQFSTKLFVCLLFSLRIAFRWWWAIALSDHRVSCRAWCNSLVCWSMHASWKTLGKTLEIIDKVLFFAFRAQSASSCWWWFFLWYFNWKRFAFEWAKMEKYGELIEIGLPFFPFARSRVLSTILVWWIIQIIIEWSAKWRTRPESRSKEEHNDNNLVRKPCQTGSRWFYPHCNWSSYDDHLWNHNQNRKANTTRLMPNYVWCSRKNSRNRIRSCVFLSRAWFPCWGIDTRYCM